MHHALRQCDFHPSFGQLLFGLFGKGKGYGPEIFTCHPDPQYQMYGAIAQAGHHDLWRDICQHARVFGNCQQHTTGSLNVAAVADAYGNVDAPLWSPVSRVALGAGLVLMAII